MLQRPQANGISAICKNAGELFFCSPSIIFLKCPKRATCFIDVSCSRFTDAFLLVLGRRLIKSSNIDLTQIFIFIYLWYSRLIVRVRNITMPRWRMIQEKFGNLDHLLEPVSEVLMLTNFVRFWLMKATADLAFNAPTPIQWKRCMNGGRGRVSKVYF